MHESAAGQDTQNSWPVGTRGFGLGVTDHPPGGPLAAAAAPAIRTVAAAVARQTAARPATVGATTLRARRGSIPDGQGRRFPAGGTGWCRFRPATGAVSPTPGTSQIAHIAGQNTFPPAVRAGPGRA